MKWKIIIITTIGILLLGIIIGGIYMEQKQIINLFPERLEGIMSFQTTAEATYNFLDNTNNKAYNATRTTNWTKAELLTVGNELPATGYTLINSNNNAYATCVNVGNSDYCMFRYVFNLNQSSSIISRLNITWMGLESTDDTAVELLVFNWTNNVWTRIGVIGGGPKGTNTTNFTGANVVNHIGSTNNNVTIAVWELQGIADGGPENISTDFVKIDVTYIDNEPQWSSNTTNGTTAGSYIKHSVNLTDVIGLSGYIFEFDNGTGVSNDSFVVANTQQNWANVSKWINTNLDTNISWRVYINDTLNQKNSTSLFNYTTTSAPPNCWSYNAGSKLLIIPTGCMYVQSLGTIGGI